MSSTDVEALTGLLTKLEAAPDEQAFAERVVPGLGSLIRCDGLGYNDIDVAAQTVRWSGEPAAMIEAGDSRREAFELNMHQRPAIAAFASSGVSVQKHARLHRPRPNAARPTAPLPQARPPQRQRTRSGWSILDSQLPDRAT